MFDKYTHHRKITVVAILIASSFSIAIIALSLIAFLGLERMIQNRAYLVFAVAAVVLAAGVSGLIWVVGHQ